jgi:hypothetical protein
MGSCQVLRTLCALVLWLSHAAQAQVGLGQSEPFATEQMLNNVVRVETDTGKGFGFGFIFGRFGDVLWIATAAHVIYPDRSRLPPQPVAGIRVQLRGLASWFTPAEPPVLASHDVAFIGISAPLAQTATVFWRNNIQVDQPTVGHPLRIAATVGRIAYSPIGTGKVVGTANAPLIAIYMGQEGQSGAPVASPEGFVGMYQKSAGERVVPIATVRDEALKAGKPWQLSHAALLPVAVRLCLTPAARSAALPHINGPAGTVQRDANNCVQTMSGMNILVSPQLGLLCDPSEVNLPRDPHQTLAVRCYVDPSGVWMSKSDGYVTVAAQGDIWTIEGLSQSKFGAFKGLLTGPPPRLQVQMRTPIGSMASGTLTLEPRRLHGRLLVDGQSFDVDLER